MKWIFGRTAMWLWATFAIATMAYAAVQDVQLPDGDGKKVLQTSCTACHDLSGVVRLHMDKPGWEGLVSSMVSNGAQVDTKDYPVLVDYLTKNFGPEKPADAAGAAGGTAAASNAGNDDAAKKVLNDVCTACHDLDMVSAQHLSKDDWQQVVSSMVAKGASLSDKDMPILVNYLAKTYPPNGPGKPADAAGAGTAVAASAGNDDAAKKVLTDVCTACHDLDLVGDQHLSKDEWQQVVTSMVAKGANLGDKDMPVLVEYLAKTYPPKK